MNIATYPAVSGADTLAQTMTDQTKKAGATGPSFASFLQTQSVTAQNASASTETAAGKTPGADEGDVGFLRQNGFQAYLERNHERKLEEMREQILSTMGLNEEALEALPEERREVIEKMIAQEIRNRLAAEAERDRAADPAVDAVAGNAANPAAPAGSSTISAQLQTMIAFSISDAVTDPTRPLYGGQYR